MPINYVAYVLEAGPPAWVSNNIWSILKGFGALIAIVLVKVWSAGATSPSERDMHGRVVMMTGGTSGIGARTAYELGRRGAQLVLLTRTPVSDPFLVEYIGDLRARTGNELIYAEQVDLASLHSIRKFATKWIDNSPPRRLDMIILAAATMTPPGSKRKNTIEGVDETWMVNYLANFHLLSILSPAIKAQPFDRDVRIIFATCPSYIGSSPLSEALDKKNWSPGMAYKRSKLALNVFGQAFQKHLDSYKRPDDLPMNARVVFVDPGYTRTPGMRRWLTRGSISGLFVYLTVYFVPWLLLKSPDQGAQSLLFAAMEAALARGKGGRLIKECREVDFARRDVYDDEVAKKLWEESDKLIEKTEKEQAVIRARQKKVQEEKGKEAEEAQKTKEMADMVEAIIQKSEAKKKNQANKGEAKTKTEQKPQGKKKSKKAT
ncbi:putative oxidoreductase [Colletotrichum sidae]|uniref:Putative oxidoreductase n=1 Tax=Colletotrichum sidae TaxID=1347389 RepID=A0A4R8TKE2_9PEZI|nr:putative oxidoreductase [Colletotrichum sidae]